MSFNTSPPPRRKPLIVALAVIVIVLTVGVVYAAFTQTLPQVNVPGQFTLTPCNPLIEVGTVTQGSGTVMFDCSGSPAFTVTGASGSSTPTFTIPTSPSTITANLGITNNGSCATGSFTGIISGSATPLSIGTYNYCLQYSNAPASGGTIGPISVTWT